MATDDDDDDDDDIDVTAKGAIPSEKKNKCTIEHYQHLTAAVRNPPAPVLKSDQSLKTIVLS